jgi:hypothetical protein
MHIAIYILCTACALLTVVCSFCAYRAVRAQARAEAEGEELARASKRVKNTFDELAALHGRVDKLAGRVYSQTRKAPPARTESGTDEESTDSPLMFGVDDPELAAELALQAAPPVQPGKTRR